MRTKLAIAIIFCTAGLSLAADISGGQPGFRNWLGGAGRSSLGLIDPSRLTVQHSASFGFSSGGGQSLMQSLYATTFAYRLSDPVSLTLLLGLQNSRLAGKTPFAGSYNSVLGGFALDYTPGSQFRLHFEVSGSPINTLPGVMQSRFGSVSGVE